MELIRNNKSSEEPWNKRQIECGSDGKLERCDVKLSFWRASNNEKCLADVVIHLNDSLHHRLLLLISVKIFSFSAVMTDDKRVEQKSLSFIFSGLNRRLEISLLLCISFVKYLSFIAPFHFPIFFKETQSLCRVKNCWNYFSIWLLRKFIKHWKSGINFSNW